MKHYMILSALLLTLTLSASAQNRDLYIYMDGKPDVQAYENVFPLAPTDDPNRYVVDSLKIVRHLKEPTGLRIELDADGLPTVIWKPVNGAKNYEVYRSVNHSPYVIAKGAIVQNWQTNEYYFTDTDPQPGTSSYRVRARGIVIESLLSSEIVSNYIDPSAIQTIDGIYNVTEYELDDETDELVESGKYPMSVELDPNDPTTATIYNFWNMRSYIEAIYDEEEQALYIPSQTAIGSHSTYGTIYIRGINSERAAYTNYITLRFTPLGGKLEEEGYFSAYVNAGTFGYYQIKAVKDDGNGTTGNAAPRKSRRQLTLKPEALKVDKNQKADCKTMITNPVRRLQ